MDRKDGESCRPTECDIFSSPTQWNVQSLSAVLHLFATRWSLHQRAPNEDTRIKHLTRVTCQWSGWVFWDTITYILWRDKVWNKNRPPTTVRVWVWIEPVFTYCSPFRIYRGWSCSSSTSSYPNRGRSSQHQQHRCRQTEFMSFLEKFNSVQRPRMTKEDEYWW